MRALLTWVAFMREDDAPTMDAYALSGLIDPRTRGTASPSSADWRHLSGEVLLVALRTYFPAPWSPEGLTDAVGIALPQEHARTHRGRILWGADPEFSAERRSDGGWRVLRSERGTVTDFAEPSTDDDMVLLLEREWQGRLPYPYGWGRRDSAIESALWPLVEPTLAVWREHARLPYIQNWLKRVRELDSDSES